MFDHPCGAKSSSIFLVRISQAQLMSFVSNLSNSRRVKLDSWRSRNIIFYSSILSARQICFLQLLFVPLCSNPWCWWPSTGLTAEGFSCTMECKTRGNTPGVVSKVPDGNHFSWHLSYTCSYILGYTWFSLQMLLWLHVNSVPDLPLYSLPTDRAKPLVRW